MKRVDCALVMGDARAPEMMEPACEGVVVAGRKDGYNVVFHKTPMGWVAWHQYGDTLPEESFRRASEIRLLFFGGVGDPQFDNTIGEQFPDQKPEAHCLLPVRKGWQLLHNFRPMLFLPEIRRFSNLVKVVNMPPEQKLEWHFIRYLLEGSYFGTTDLYDRVANPKEVGLVRKGEFRPGMDLVAEMSYYSRSLLIDYFRGVFEYARRVGLPVISVDKKNICTRYELWDEVLTQVRAEFPDVKFKARYHVDAAHATLIEKPWLMHGVIACGDAHGDHLTDAGAASLGSMGIMYSSAVNLKTGAAMFESGAGTAPNVLPDRANPIGRMLTGAELLRHVGAVNGADRIWESTLGVLRDGYRTDDIASRDTPPNMILGTREMGRKIIERL